MRPEVLSVLTQKYSGSTILAYVLATHPDVVTIGEGQKLHQKVIRPPGDLSEGGRTCSCGVPFADCPFWREVGDALRRDVPERILHLDFTEFRFYAAPRPHRLLRSLALRLSTRNLTALIPPPLGARYRAVARANARLARAVIEAGGGRVYLETGKDPVSAILLARSPFVKGRVLHLVRDGRGQVFSAVRHSRRLDLEAAARLWVETTRLHQSLLARQGDELLTVRYEDFCADPHGVSRRVFAFAGLDPDRGSLEFRRETRHIMGNAGVRLGDVGEIRDRQEWREAFNPTDRETFERIAGPLNRGFGYD